MWKLLVQTPLRVNLGIGTTSLYEVPSNLEVKIRIKKTLWSILDEWGYPFNSGLHVIENVG